MESITEVVAAAYVGVFAAVIGLLANRTFRLASTDALPRPVAAVCTLAVTLWYLASLILSAVGFFKSPLTYSSNDVLGLVWAVALMSLPLGAFLALLRRSLLLRKAIAALDLRFLIGIQVYRILGVYFLLLMLQNRAPAPFALPAAIADVAVGVSATILAYTASSLTSAKVRLIRTWNYIGILDFVMAFALYFLYFPFKLIEVSPEMVMWAGFYPVAFIVLFVVPLSTMLHIMALEKISELGIAASNSFHVIPGARVSSRICGEKAIGE